jgi:hypothetical protein
MSLLEGRNFRLVDPENRGRLALREPAPLDLLDNLRRQFRFCQQVIGLR